MKNKILGFAVLIGICLLACSRKEGCTDITATNYDEDAEKNDGSCIYDESDDTYIVPNTYAFKDDNGNSTVNYSGQTDRLDMLAEMTTLMQTGNTSGTTVDAQVLKDMFANTGGHFTASNLNSSTKQLENKCFSLDQDLFKSFMDSLAVASQSQTAGSDGVAGVVSNGTKSYLASSQGVEYTQLIEKGLMGAVLYYQIAEVYTRDGKIGDAVDNTTAVDPANGKYYTDMEHHWDEAFGYFGVSIDFPTNTSDARFIGKYANSRDDMLGTNALIMNAYLKGRAAISNNDKTTKNAQAIEVRKQVELVFASTAIHYLNGAKTDFADDALRIHQLSEAYAFAWSLKYNADKTISDTDWNDVMNAIGTNFYNITIADIDAARNLLSSVYGLDQHKDHL